MSDLTDLGVKAIRDGVAAGTFSALEVAEAFNANVAAASALNAFIVATPDAALDAAKATDYFRRAHDILEAMEAEGRDLSAQMRGGLEELRQMLGPKEGGQDV